MSIKSEVKKVEVKQSNIKFPVLMERVNHRFVVLFESKTVGMVVSRGISCQTLESRDDWISCYNGNVWKKFEGVLELSNEEEE